jgi:hypothetical protein
MSTTACKVISCEAEREAIATANHEEDHATMPKLPSAISFRTLLSTAAVILPLMMFAPARAQETAPDLHPIVAQPDATQAAAAQVDVTQDQTQNPPPAQPQSSASSSSQAPAPDYNWHVSLSPYLWFPGMHGTTGAFNRDVSVHASAGDLLSHFRFGIQGAVEARWQLLLLNGDLFWVRLGDDKAVPAPRLGAVSADMRAGELIWTSKVGARLLDKEKFKADANIGVRFWHLGQKVTFNPSLLGLDFKSSENWGDLVIGGRTQAALSPKAQITLLGDVGGWGTGAKLDYQFAALLGYKFKPKWTLEAGYRYLFVDYRTAQFLYNTVASGIIFGATYKWK